MTDRRRFFARSPDGRGIAGYETHEAAEFVALEYGDGAHLIDTLAPVYHPMIQEVESGELVFLPFGGWDAGRFDAEGNLIEGIKKGHPAIVHALLAKGADAGARDRNGGPAICWAAAGGNPDIVSLLVGFGADVDARDADGTGAIEIAEQRGKTEIVELLRRSASKA